MSTATLVNETAEMEQLKSFFKLIHQHLVDAARLIHAMVQKDPQAMDKIREAIPGVPPGFLNKLLRVGEGSLNPRLVMNGAPAYARLSLMPVTVQDRVLKDDAVEMAVNADSSASIRVPLTELTSEQIALVFCGNGVRSVDEQRAYLKRQEVTSAKPVSRAEAFPWVVKKDEVTILRPVTLKHKDIMRILEELNA